MRAGYELEFGKRVRVRRLSQAMSQRALAARVKLPRQRISEIEKGARGLTVRTLLKMARALQTTPSSLIDGLEEIT